MKTQKNRAYGGKCTHEVRMEAIKALEKQIPKKVIYNMFDMIDKDKNLFVFIYRDKNKNKQQNIVFVTDIDFDEIDCESFFRKYKMKFNGKEKLLKLKWREFKRNYVKFS